MGYTQKDKREYFKKQLDELKDSIEDKIDDFLENSEELKRFISFRRKHFYSYSINNTLLIYKQMPQASNVAGYNKWKELGYQVKKGSKAINILIPLIRKNNEEENKIYGFKRGNVFDFSQVESTEKDKELPSIDTSLKITKSTGISPTKLLQATEDFIEQHCKVIETEELGSALGMTNGKEIYIKPNANRVDKAGILIHEFAHYHNHYKENRKKLTKDRKESEAEITTLLFGSFFNLNIDGTYKYLSMYRKERDLSSCFETAYKTFEYILDGKSGISGLEHFLNTTPAL